MSETLGGVYNPQAMPEAEFLARYSVRLELTDRLLRMILGTGPEDEPAHAIVQGQRGQGKTSLLRRIQIALRENEETRDWLLPLLFKEELYGVTSLCRLWEETAELLSGRAGFEGIPAAIEAVWQTPHYEKDCYRILGRVLAERGVRLVLLLDNIGGLFGKLKRPEQQRLREILHTTKHIQIIGASTVMLEQHYDHGAPFYQFFREINLPGLSQAEALALLRHLGSAEQQTRLEEVIARTPGRIETLRRLTAGVPRTLVLLFEILLDRDGNAFRDLELLLDRVTPLYKHRMDDLPPQQQAIVDAVALGWDAMSAGEIARATRLPSKQVAAQLRQLERADVIHREPTSTKNNLYRLAERFFNIWYLMRHGRSGDRRRALWLVRFLEIWCTPDDLRERALGHLAMLTDRLLAPEHAWLMTEALRGAGLDLETEDRLVKATRAYLPGDMQNQVGPSVSEIVEAVEASVQPLVGRMFDRERMAKMGASDLREYVKRAREASNELISLLESRGNILARVRDSLDQGEVAETLFCIEELGKLALPESCYLYPGLLRIWEKTNKSNDKLLKAACSLETDLGEASGHDWRLLLAAAMVRKESFPIAFEMIEAGLPELDLDAKAEDISELLTLLLAADQTAYVRRLFEDEPFAAYRLRDRFKPHYFALLAELGSARADDLKRMGPELAQTVDEIRTRIVEWRQKYFEQSPGAHEPRDP